MKPRAGLRQFAFALLARVTYQSKAKDIQLSLSQAMTKLRQDAGRSPLSVCAGDAITQKLNYGVQLFRFVRHKIQLMPSNAG